MNPAGDGGAERSRARLGFIGLGWIGRQRMEALLATGLVDAHAAFEPDASAFERASSLAPGLLRAKTVSSLFDLKLDGVVIATPSALHVEQSVQALRAGCAVFCQKPLGRTETEVASVVEAARTADRLLAVDYSYRFTAGLLEMRRQILRGDLGRLFALDLTFHNAYGPDKAWFYDVAQSGGGCLIDLGVHLVDLALWVCGATHAEVSQASLRRGGERLRPGGGGVEDYAVATLELEGAVVARLACSWRLNAGREAEIGVCAYGDKGGIRFANVGGSFYDFAAERLNGTGSVALTSPPDAWGGRAAADWAERLHAGAGFDPAVEDTVRTARLLDGVYAAAQRD